MSDTKRVQIIVAGHAVLKAEPNADPMTEEGLVLLDYQQDGRHHLIFQEHIRRGLKLTQGYLDDGWQVQLIFSGGISRRESPHSEATTYLMMAQRLSEWRAEYEELIVLEEYARDSYENLLYGCAAGFAQQSRTGTAYIPDAVVLISFEFKRQRFNYHAASMGLVPAELATASTTLPLFHYEGVGNPLDLGKTYVAEAEAIEMVLFDPHGLSGECQQKRNDGRNPLNRFQNYTPEVADWPLIHGLLQVNSQA